MSGMNFLFNKSYMQINITIMQKQIKKMYTYFQYGPHKYKNIFEKTKHE